MNVFDLITQALKEIDTKIEKAWKDSDIEAKNNISDSVSPLTTIQIYDHGFHLFCTLTEDPAHDTFLIQIFPDLPKLNSSGKEWDFIINVNKDTITLKVDISEQITRLAIYLKIIEQLDVAVLEI